MVVHLGAQHIVGEVERTCKITRGLTHKIVREAPGMLPNKIRPTRIRLEASSVCQLRCPSCPTHGGTIRPAVGSGFLKLADFEELLRKNPRLRDIELSNYGEIFLNPDLPGILKCAYDRGVALAADTGVNLNTVSDEILEALVKYRLRSVSCSIDGASEQTYRLYRVNGSLSTVIENIRKLNALKREYRSEFPKLQWQYVVFGHNEHEVPRAKELAKALDMSFQLKLAWDSQLSPVMNEGLLRKEIGAASREEYKQRFGVDYVQRICHELWNEPQINWDGKVLGCCRNFWGDFGANAFADGLVPSVNSARMRYARQMLMGRKPARDGIPCATCSMYLDMRTEGKWLDRSQVAAEYRRVTGRALSPKVRKSAAYRGARFIYRSIRPRSMPGLASRVYPVGIPLPPDEEQGWKPYHVFAGSAKGLAAWSCHVSALTQGTCPHPPHVHAEEEILMLLSGEVDLILPDIRTPAGNERRRLQPGQFAYYPAHFAHTLQATSSAPANYLMFRWLARSRSPKSRLACGLFNTFGPGAGGEVKSGFSSRLILEGPTDYLPELHCHCSSLAPGRGYDPHVDAHNVAIIVLDGEVETLGERVGPHAVILYAAGEPHGMRNPGRAAARYVVFEFHSREKGLVAGLRNISTRRRGQPDDSPEG
jgi:MoaA/NifB/PqqE/SkfB family radical SAM enzyme/quercetin dioxygenase-like cupin family protein